MNHETKQGQAEIDEEREKRIASAYRRLVCAPNKEAKERAWEEMKSEINARSIEQVIRMEGQRGIA